MAEALITYMERRNRLHDLVVLADNQRPHMTWFEDGNGEIGRELVTEGDLFLMYGLQMWLNYRSYKH